MLIATFTTLVVIAALGFSIQSEKSGGLIGEHRYNNRANDASGARADHLG